VQSPGEDGPPGSLRITWIRPAERELLSDTVRCAVRIESGVAIRAALLADDSLVADRGVAPWTFLWLPADTAASGLAEPRTFLLRVSAGEPDGRVSFSAPLSVRWIPNGIPRLRFVGVEDPAWIERVEGESLRVEAIDPEDGILRGPSIEWRSDREGALGLGERIPVGSLIAGRHRIRVRAVDRCLRAVSVEIRVEVFEYSNGATPQAVLDDLRFALLDRRPDVYEEGLAAGFSFVFCPADREVDPSVPVRWGPQDEIAFVRKCLTDPAIRFDRLDWTSATIQETRIGGQIDAKAEIAGISIRIVTAPQETLAVLGGAARVYLGRDPGTGRWRLAQWQDLGAVRALTQGMMRIRVTRPEPPASSP
jgi:hypothetical protein